MTNEQALEILKRKTAISNDGETFEAISEAFDLAVEALEKQLSPKRGLEHRHKEMSKADV